MAKRNIHPDQFNFMDMLETPQVLDINIEGSFEYEQELRQDLNKAIKDHKTRTGEDRHALAATLSRATNLEISKNSLDCWTAPSRTDWRFPAQVLPAFIEATQAMWLLEKIANKCGLVVMTAEDAEMARLGKLKQMEALLKEEIKKSQERVKGL